MAKPISHVRALPDFDKDLGTRRVCIYGLVISWILSTICVGIGSYTMRTPFPQFGVKQQLRILLEILPLAINVVITGCVECLGFIHTTSLRWALWRENRLAFNSNIRLFNHARTCPPNSWPVNMVSALSIAICYTASSQLFLASGEDLDAKTVNSVALLTLGIGLMVQCIVSTWSLTSTSGLLLSWSSKPLNTALAGLHNGLEPQRGRCMVPAPAPASQVERRLPSSSQPSMRQVYPSVRHVTRILVAITFAFLCWAVAIMTISLRNDRIPDMTFQGVNAGFGIGLEPGLKWWAVNTQASVTLLIVFSIQTGMTIALHCIELIANLSRDEDIWRRAYGSRNASQLREHPESNATKKGRDGRRGATLKSSSIKRTLTSWQTLVLFVMRPLTHWFFGLGIFVEVYFIFSVSFRCMPLYGLTGCTLLLVIGTVWQTRRKPQGPQPVTWGHLQSIGNLIDDWGVADTLYWGDKGYGENGSRHAGTSATADRVGTIRMDCLYSGR